MRRRIDWPSLALTVAAFAGWGFIVWRVVESL